MRNEHEIQARLTKIQDDMCDLMDRLDMEQADAGTLECREEALRRNEVREAMLSWVLHKDPIVIERV